MEQACFIIPVYNVEDYLKECLDSVLSQSYSNFFVVLVDDGSTDNSPCICDEYAKKDKRIVVIHSINGGAGRARNVGLDYMFSHFDNEFVLFVDSDDILDKHFLSKMINAAYCNDMVVCKYQPFHSENGTMIFREIQPQNESIHYKEPFQIIDILPTNKIYRKKLFLNLRYPDCYKCCEDEFLVHKIYGSCSNIAFLNEPLYFYRQRNGSIMSSKGQTDEMKLTLLFARIDRVDYYLFTKPDENSFIINYRYAFDYLVYFKGKKKYRRTTNHQFLHLKNVYKNHKSKLFGKSKGETFFFCMPRLYIFMKRLFRFLGDKYYLIKLNIYYFLYNHFFKKPKILSKEETILSVINNRISVSRFGDGEFSLMLSLVGTIGFQRYNDSIKENLLRVFASEHKNVLLCIPNYSKKRHLNNKYGKWLKTFVFDNWKMIKQLYDYSYTYGDSDITRFYHPDLWRHTDNEYLEKEYIPLLKKIWESKRVLVVEGIDSKIGVGNDLFDNAFSIKRILCPNNDAFEKYNEIVNSVQAHKDNIDLVLLALGPTASILSVDLTINYNLWCVDIGHVDIVYLWFLNRAKTKCGISGKNVNEKRNLEPELICDDTNNDVYKKQIVDIIE